MKLPRLAVGLVAVVILLSGCTPQEGGHCTTVGQTVTTEDGQDLRCQTNEGETTPHWTAI